MRKTLIVSPYYETGGPEALHQLCDAINNNGGDAYIWYFGEDHDKPHPAYTHYNIKLTKELVDEEGYAIVFPEGEGKRIKQFKKAKLYFWWLSVNNAVLQGNHFLDYGNTFDDDRITHLYQSYFALHYLWSQNAVRYLPLFDFINDKYISESLNITPKENIVCFNPKKGYEYTYHLTQILPNVTFVPLVNMTREQVVDTLRRSKVYIDFGYHPGKDRFPREAALMNNCVITRFTGSAMFYNDMPIDLFKYKFDIDSLGHAAQRIEDCLTNYDERIKDFELYKSVIKNQKEEFNNQVKQIF
jgi:signal peptidase I